MEIYRRLIKDSIDLVKANEILEKLNRKISERDAELQKIKTENSNSKMDHLSAVSNKFFKMNKFRDISHYIYLSNYC